MAFGSLLLSSSIFFLAIGIWFNSNDFRPKEYFLPQPPKLVGPLAANNVKNVERILHGKIHGPESLVVEKNTIYTCLQDGKCIKIVDGKIQKTVSITSHKDCTGQRKTFAYCGRPLGIRRFDSNKFVVIDAMLGLFFVNFEKATVELILSSQISLDGKRLGFPDDIDFPDNDTIIFSDASTRYGFQDFLMSFLEHAGDGRIVQFKISTGELKVLMDGLNFPNGVQIHPDHNSVLFTESVMARIHRYYYAGPKKGRHEMFTENLPGLPDNIRLSVSGKSFYVALLAYRDENSKNFFDLSAQRPLLRKIVGEITSLVPENLMLWLFEASSQNYGIFVEVDLNGKIINSYHDPTGEFIKHISQISDDQDHLYLGSYSNDYIGRVSKK